MMSLLMGNARLVWGLVMVPLALSAATVASAAALSAHRSTVHGSTARETTLFMLYRPVQARAAPGTGAKVVGVIPVRTPLAHSQMTLPVVQTAFRRGSGKWLRVRLPTRPDGGTGWVRADAGSVGS